MTRRAAMAHASHMTANSDFSSSLPVSSAPVALEPAAVLPTRGDASSPLLLPLLLLRPQAQ